jgi:hypothetical protein
MELSSSHIHLFLGSTLHKTILHILLPLVVYSVYLCNGEVLCPFEVRTEFLNSILTNLSLRQLKLMVKEFLTYMLNHVVIVLGGVVVIVLATEPTFRGLKPCIGRRIFKGDKIHSTISFGGELKPSASCRKIFSMLKIHAKV